MRCHCKCPVKQVIYSCKSVLQQWHIILSRPQKVHHRKPCVRWRVNTDMVWTTFGQKGTRRPRSGTGTRLRILRAKGEVGHFERCQAQLSWNSTVPAALHNTHTYMRRCWNAGVLGMVYTTPRLQERQLAQSHWKPTWYVKCGGRGCSHRHSPICLGRMPSAPSGPWVQTAARGGCGDWNGQVWNKNPNTEKQPLLIDAAGMSVVGIIGFLLLLLELLERQYFIEYCLVV